MERGDGTRGVEGKGSEMRGLLTTRFGGDNEARFRRCTRPSEADDEGVSDVIGVRGAAVVMRRSGECPLICVMRNSSEH